MIKSTDENKQSTAKKDAEVQEARSVLYKKLETIGNLVHDSVPVSNDEVWDVYYFLLIFLEFTWISDPISCQPVFLEKCDIFAGK